MKQQRLDDSEETETGRAGSTANSIAFTFSLSRFLCKGRAVSFPFLPRLFYKNSNSLPAVYNIRRSDPQRINNATASPLTRVSLHFPSAIASRVASRCLHCSPISSSVGACIRERVRKRGRTINCSAARRTDVVNAMQGQ